MKTALLIGCGGDRAKNIVKGCYNTHDKIYNIGSTPIDTKEFPKAENIYIDWKKFDIQTTHQISKDIKDINFIFFNQNGSSLSQDVFIDILKTIDIWVLIKRWSQTYWASCQFPYALIKSIEHELTDNTKIGWMLSSYIDCNQKDVEQYPDYSGNKYTNYLMMKSFNTKYKCFGINPDFSKNNITQTIENICNETEECDGQVFGID